MSGKQRGPRAIFPGAETGARGAGAAELECEVARANCAVPMAAAHRDFRVENEPAVSRPAHGEWTRTRGSVGGAEHWVDAACQSPSGAGCSGLPDLAGAARVYPAGNFGDEHRIVGGIHHVS